MIVSLKNDISNEWVELNLRDFIQTKRIETIWRPGTYKVSSFDADFVLVVEKESVMYDLVETGFMIKHPNSVLVTGKGYADINTKHLLKSMFMKNPAVPFLYLGDYDPFGIEIYLNYIYSNPISMYEDLSLPIMEYIGVDGRTLYEYFHAHFLPLSTDDYNKIEGLLGEKYFEERVDRGEYMCTFSKMQVYICYRIICMLIDMQMSHLKAEIELLSSAACIHEYIEYHMHAIGICEKGRETRIVDIGWAMKR